VRDECAETRAVAWDIRFRHDTVQPPPPAPVKGLQADVSYHEVKLDWQDSEAARFRIERSDGRVSETSETEYSDMEIAPGVEYVYRVRSIGWQGNVSEAALVEVTTLDELKLPPVPPKPDVAITALKPRLANTGWGEIGTNRTCQGKPITLLGQVYEPGIGVHAPSTLVYTIPNGAKRFVAIGGLDDERRDDPRQSVVLKVLGDAGEMGESPVILGESPLLSDETLRVWHFDIELSARLQEVHLVVTDGGDGIACDHVDWVDAGFVVSE
jgi:hypothetical protein